MNQSVEQAFEAEQIQYQANLQRIADMDPIDADQAHAAERRRHMWAICGIWHGRVATWPRPKRASGE